VQKRKWPTQETTMVVGKCPLCDGTIALPPGRSKNFGAADQPDARKSEHQQDAATDPPTNKSEFPLHDPSALALKNILPYALYLVNFSLLRQISV
jgi:hypothetical protein